MDRHTQRVWRHAEPGGDFHLRHRSLIAPDEDFERVKMLLPARGGGFIPQTGKHLVQQRERPALFKGLIRRRGGVSGFDITNGGAGYAFAPAVTLIGGSGTGATATATINASGVVTAINVTNGGTGYATALPTVAIEYRT